MHSSNHSSACSTGTVNSEYCVCGGARILYGDNHACCKLADTIILRIQCQAIRMSRRNDISRRDLLKLLGAALTVGRGSQGILASFSPVEFVDVARRAGITFRHDNAASPQKYLIETMGSGCGWIDYDQNGLLDLYLVNSAATKLYQPGIPPRSALYRNNGDGTFTDVTAKAGVGAEGLFGMGVAVGDYDNDGFPDLFVVGYDRCILYHNEGNGTFTDVTAKAGVGNLGKWGSSAAWF